MRSFAQLHTVSSYAIWLGLCSVKVFTFIYGVHSAFRKYTSVQKNRNNRQQQQQLKIYLTSIVLHCYEFGNVRSKMFENELLLPRNRKVFHVTCTNWANKSFAECIQTFICLGDFY